MVIPTHRVMLGGRRHARRGAITPVPPPTGSPAVALTSGAARAVTLVGAKAANLATATAAKLPVLPGFAVPVATVAQAVAAGGFSRLPADTLDELHAAWCVVANQGAASVVARSSAISEDAEGSSMAGRFLSCLDVSGWRAFLTALDEVADSATVVSLDGSRTVEVHDMAILVQRFLPAAYGGVLFGADPVSGRLDRFALATVRGGPEALVSGEDGGAHQVLTRHGRLLHTEGDATVAPSWSRRRELAALARHAAAVFGAPQDVEWAVDGSGRLWLLQSRPVTTLTDGTARGPLLGPGPLAETFPDPLTVLEQDLWLTPVREGIIHAIDITGAVPRRRLRSSPVALAVGGRPALDLGLVGAIEEKAGLVQKLDPRPPARRLRAAWRTGRLRRALPDLSRQLIDQVDRELRGIPALAELDDDLLVGVLHGSRRTLVALHGQEVLAGLLLRDASTAGGSGAAAALTALHRARSRGVPEEAITARSPEVLALVPPAVRPATLPPCTAALPSYELHTPPEAQAVDEVATLRELLRLRARWVQELSALAAWELGVRLHARGVLADPGDVRLLDLRGVEAALAGHRPQPIPAGDVSAPLPARFRLDAAGVPHAVVGDDRKVGQGAGGGRAAGRVVHDPAEVTGDEPVVLVTATLAPGLAAVLPGLAGLVAETGSVLSHLAILSRELHVPTVVGVEGAHGRFPAGVTVLVDGVTGSVEVIE